jgi:hypothetical protein
VEVTYVPGTLRDYSVFTELYSDEDTSILLHRKSIKKYTKKKKVG